ncbi:MAG TPA: MFS transporter [Gaiellaceae bacterium]|nr:MFS transporter [Gaiellaceae bacterium]
MRPSLGTTIAPRRRAAFRQTLLTDIEREPPPERGLLGRIAVDVSPLRESRDFRRLWFGTGISAIGSQITTVAIPYQVYQETRSTFVVGLLGIAALVPLLIVPIYGGAVADAVDRRRLLLLSDLALVGVTGGLIVNALLPDPSVLALFGAEALGTAAYGFQRPARNALTPGLVRPDQLMAALTVEDVVFTLARVAGPVLAGGLIAVVGLAGAYAIDLGTFGASLVAIWLLPPVPPAPDAARPSLNSILDGFRYIARRQVLLGIFLVDTLVMIFGMPRALFPAFAEELGGGAGTLGLLYGATSFGALLASLTSGWMLTVRRQGLAVCIAAAGWGVAISIVGFAGSVWFAFAFLAVAGASDFVSAVLRSTILLSVTPDAMRGRLSGIELAQVAGAPEIGNLEAGIVASLTSVRTSIVSGGILSVVGAVAVALALPALVHYDARKPRDE